MGLQYRLAEVSFFSRHGRSKVSEKVLGLIADREPPLFDDNYMPVVGDNRFVCEAFFDET